MSAGKKRALLVGVQEYEYRGIPNLKCTVNDVKGLSRELVDSAGFDPADITLMTSDLAKDTEFYPTHSNVIFVFEELAKTIEREDTFLFYFSGHGFGYDGDDHFLATVNADARSRGALRSTALSLSQLQESMTAIKAGQIILILDACRNDPVADSKGSGDPGLTSGFSSKMIEVASSLHQNYRRTVILKACREKQKSWEWREKGYSVFTYFLMEGLRKADIRNGNSLTVNSLSDYVHSCLENWCEENRPGESNRQTPDFQQFGSPSIILTQKPLLKKTDAQNPSVISVNEPLVEVIKSHDLRSLLDSAYSELSGLPVPLAKSPTTISLPRTVLNKNDGAQMILIPACEFMMGDEDQENNLPHKVKLSAYYIYKNLVSVGQYEKYCNLSGKKMPTAPVFNTNWEKKNHPIVNVNWEEARDYCKWATDGAGDLPSEAQWERAARGTQRWKYPWGDVFDEKKLWFNKSIRVGTTEVGVYGVSPDGCTDMAGNVWQWCLDSCDAKFWESLKSQVENPVNLKKGESRVLRGGSWGDLNPVYFRSSFRLDFIPSNWVGDNGFRCVSGLL